MKKLHEKKDRFPKIENGKRGLVRFYPSVRYCLTRFMLFKKIINNWCTIVLVKSGQMDPLIRNVSQLLYILKTVGLNQLANEFFRLYNLNRRALNQRIMQI
jgi:hypothetical protein